VSALQPSREPFGVGNSHTLRKRHKMVEFLAATVCAPAVLEPRTE
jgi:hypothetical protein